MLKSNFVKKNTDSGKSNEYIINKINNNEEQNECPICYEPITSITGSSQSKCGHIFCSSCFIKTVRMNVHCPTCPMCRENLL